MCRTPLSGDVFLHMLLPLLVRLCTLGIMAPALSEVSQGQELQISHTTPPTPPPDNPAPFETLTEYNTVKKNLWNTNSNCELSSLQDIIKGTVSESSKKLLLFLRSLQLSKDSTSLFKGSFSEGSEGMNNCSSIPSSNNMGISPKSETLGKINPKFTAENGDIGQNEMLSIIQSQIDKEKTLPNSEVTLTNPEVKEESQFAGELDASSNRNGLKGLLVNRENQMRLRLEDLTKRQNEIEKRSERVLRRIRRIQGGGLVNHTSKQLSQAVDQIEKKLPTNQRVKELQKTLITGEKVHVSSSEVGGTNTPLLNYALKVTPKEKLRDPCRSETADSNRVLVRLNEELASDIRDTCGNMGSHLHTISRWGDGDVTESSSGGESADELDKFPKKTELSVSYGVNSLESNSLAGITVLM